jgi:hypothetical protein
MYSSIVVFYQFFHHFYISHVTPGDGLSAPKCVASGVIKIHICMCDGKPCVCLCSLDKPTLDFLDTHCSSKLRAENPTYQAYLPSLGF